MSPYGLNIGDRIRTPSGLTGTVKGFPAGQGYRAVLVDLDNDKYLQAAVYPHSVLRLLEENKESDEHTDE